MTSDGSALTRFRLALRSGNPLLVETTARELGRVSLADALGICLVFLAAGETERFRRAAVRWHGRYAGERSPGPEEAELVLAALLALAGSDGLPARAGAEALIVLLSDRGLTHEVEHVEAYALRFQ